MKQLLYFLSFAGSVLGQEAAPKPKLSLEVKADYLALHLSGTAPAGSTAVQFRLAEKESVSEDMAWLALPTAPAADGSFKADLPLASSRWSELQVRALKGDEVLAKKETHSESSHDFEMLTPERVAALSEPERSAWTRYLKRSVEHYDAEYAQLSAECRKLGVGTSKPAPGNSAEFEPDDDVPATWYTTPETLKLAQAVMSYQTPTGGWSKAVDYALGPRQPGTHWTSHRGDDSWHYCGTLDNRTTTEQIKFLASFYSATQKEEAKSATLRGIEYLLEAQYPNGGWPQNYPIESGYHEAITLNDDAMVHVLEVLTAVAEQKEPFLFVDDALRARVASTLQRGIACLLAMQVKVADQRTVWCAQHDPLSLAPVAARAKEPPSLSGAESAAVLKYLMRMGPLTPEVTAAVDSGLTWLTAHQVTGLRKTKNAAGKTDYVSDATSTEVYWARFYDVKSATPLFAGAQDGIVYSTFTEMAAKNKVGYDYFTTKPRDVIGKEVSRWKKR